MNSGNLLNRAEILMYSSLTSILSGMNRFKSKIQRFTASGNAQSKDVALAASQPINPSPARTFAHVWIVIEHIFITLVLWAILGFAAGFLIGMLQVR